MAEMPLQRNIPIRSANNNGTRIVLSLNNPIITNHSTKINNGIPIMDATFTPQQENNLREIPYPNIDIKSSSRRKVQIPQKISERINHVNLAINSKVEININPYIGLDKRMIGAIANERDIRLMGDDIDKANQLHELDNIMPDWIDSIKQRSFENFEYLDKHKLLIYGRIHGVKIYGEKFSGLNNSDIVTYIKVIISLGLPGNNIKYRLIDNLSRELLELVIEELGLVNNIKYISTDDLKIVLKNGNCDHISEYNIINTMNRHRALINHKYKHYLEALYSINSTNEEQWISISRTAPHPMERIIDNFDKFNDEEFIVNLGMIIPNNLKRNRRNYIENNVVSYAKILTRFNIETIPLSNLLFMDTNQLMNYMHQLTDKEIFHIIQVYVPYNSRNELVRNATNIITERKFLVPLIRDSTKCHNVITTLDTEITDTSTFIIGFGTAFKYRIYEIEELIAAFYNESQNGIKFRLPENPKEDFKINDIYSLMDLLQSLNRSNEINLLIERINQGLIDFRERMESDEIIKSKFIKFNNNEKNFIKEFLHQIFYIGMYMRRWKGPGHPFPLKESETTDQNFSPNEKVSREIGLSFEIINKMGKNAKKFCLELNQCQYNKNGNINNKHIGFGDIWDDVIKEKSCIRLSSTIFIGTGLHYLRVLFRETISGIDLSKLDIIS